MNMTAKLGVLLLPLFLAACATGPEEDAYYAELKQKHEQLSATEEVRLAAAPELLNAGEALDAAAATGDEDEREHQLYLARQYLAIAEISAERKDIERRMENLATTEREQELRQARERTEVLESELAALEAKRTERGVLITLDDVFFETAQANIPPGASDRLDKLIGYLETHPDQEVIVEGHTDSIGPADYNRQLSRERAESVRNAIVAQGISEGRVTARGLGESRPVASNANPGGRQLNRRVEIVLPQEGR